MLTSEVGDLSVGAGLLLVGLLWTRRDAGARGGLMQATGVAWWVGSAVDALTFLHRAGLVALVLWTEDVRGKSRYSAAPAVLAGLVAVPAASGDDVAVLVIAALVVVGSVLARNGVPGVLLGLALVVGPLSRIGRRTASVQALAMYELLVVLVAVAVVVQALGSGAQRTLTGLVVDLGEEDRSDALQERLARALGDPSLTIGYWIPEQHMLVDEAGLAMDVPQPDRSRTTTDLVADGQQLGVLIHDASVVTDPQLLAGVVAAARWAMTNVRLRAQVRAQLTALAASRERIITAADDELRRLGASLRSGPVARLSRIAELALAAGPPLSDLAGAIGRAQEDLELLGRGLHPPGLLSGGLPRALPVLATLCRTPVDLQVPPLRLAADIEAAAYFVCAEALTNVGKYAQASHVLLRVTATADAVQVLVADDGVGGVDLQAGTGLRGLQDRLEAIGGHLLVNSSAERGTSLRAVLPRRDSVVLA